MKIDINEVKNIQKRMDEINSVPIEHIQWMDGDKEIIVSSEHIKEWKFIGLDNMSFISTGFLEERNDNRETD